MPKLSSELATKVSETDLFMYAALYAAEKEGREVFPVRPGQKQPPLYPGWNSPDAAHPNRATTSQHTIRRWWREHPRANIASCLREDEFAIELEHGQGRQQWNRFWKTVGELPRTLRHRTASGKLRVYFRFPPGVTPLPLYKELEVEGHPGINYQGPGRLIIWPGSRVNERLYYAEVSAPVIEATPEFVEWLRARLPEVNGGGPDAARAVDRRRRWSAEQPCPICGGWPQLPQGQGVRCYGFLSDDEEYARCTQDADPAPHLGIAKGPDDCYPHRLSGICACGRQHTTRGLAPVEVPEIVSVRSLPEPTEFPLDVLPPPAADLVRALIPSRLSPDFLATSALAVLATAVGGRASFHSSSWDEPLVLWFLLCGDPSTRKSPAVGRVIQPLEEQETTWLAEWERDYEQWKQLPDEERKRNRRPTRRRLLTTDATLEALTRVLRTNPAGILWHSDEIRALIQGLGQYKGQGGRGADRGRLLSAWSAKPLEPDRVRDEDDPISVPRPIIQVVGGIQPALLGTVISGVDGLRQRFLYCEGRQEGASRIVEVAREQAAWSAFVRRLLREREEPRQLGLTPRALVLRDRLADQVFEAQRDDDSGEPVHVRDWLGKADAQLFRLSLLFAALDRRENITAEHFEKGERLLRYFWSQLRGLPFQQPNLMLPTHQQSQDEAVQRLWTYLRRKHQESDGQVWGATSRQIQRAEVAGLKTKDEVLRLLQRFEATWPGQVLRREVSGDQAQSAAFLPGLPADWGGVRESKK